MKKILVLILVLFSVLLGYSLGRPFDPFDKLRVFDSLRSLRSSTLRSLGLEEINQPDDHSGFKKAILRIGLVADSHNENELLARALKQAQGKGINFVIGLGDYTNLGMLEELAAAKQVFDESGLEYWVTAGDRDGWESRNRENVDNFAGVFGKATQVFRRNGVHFVILDNSDIYKGISDDDWEMLAGGRTLPGLTFVFAHKTPFHPESSHVMGEGSPQVAEQANQLIKLIEKDDVDGFFSGDLHFFARFKSPQQSVKITTIGAVARERNFQGPRFGILTVWDDYSWEVEDVEIR